MTIIAKNKKAIKNFYHDNAVYRGNVNPRSSKRAPGGSIVLEAAALAAITGQVLHRII